jgi:hypothetical protein
MFPWGFAFNGDGIKSLFVWENDTNHLSNTLENERENRKGKIDWVKAWKVRKSKGFLKPKKPDTLKLSSNH